VTGDTYLQVRGSSVVNNQGGMPLYPRLTNLLNSLHDNGLPAIEMWILPVFKNTTKSTGGYKPPANAIPKQHIIITSTNSTINKVWNGKEMRSDPPQTLITELQSDFHIIVENPNFTSNIKLRAGDFSLLKTVGEGVHEGLPRQPLHVNFRRLGHPLPHALPPPHSLNSPPDRFPRLQLTNLSLWVENPVQGHRNFQITTAPEFSQSESGDRVLIALSAFQQSEQDSQQCGRIVTSARRLISI